MISCCVPGCGTDSTKCDPSITFHEIPSSQIVVKKWITQVRAAVGGNWTMSSTDVFCSKHFLETDFKENTDVLKPHSVPTIFGHKFIGENPSVKDVEKQKEITSSPLIVKVATPRPNAVLKNVSPTSVRFSWINPSVQNIRPTMFRPMNTAVRSVRPIRPKIVADQNDGSVLSKSFSSTIANVNPVTVQKAIISNLPDPAQSDFRENVCSVSDSSPQLSSPIQIDNVSSLSTPTLLNPKIHNVLICESEEEPVVTACESPKNQYEVQTIFKRPALKRSLEDIPKPLSRKKEKINEDLIEISPNTFLRINPDIIKVNKKLTPTGNTVLQFVMDPKVAKGKGSELIPRIVQGPVPQRNTNANNKSSLSLSDSPSNQVSINNGVSSQSNSSMVQHVVGHLVNTDNTKESSGSDENDSEMLSSQCTETADFSLSENQELTEGTNKDSDANKSRHVDSSFLQKAPVLLTTTMPISHCFTEKTRYLQQLKQRGRQISSLKAKIANMQKKIDELEDRCIVQERQLSYSFIKKLKSVRKNAAKGDPCATYILEQLRYYTNSGQKMRWSDSTLAQCAIWCRKAPYAYEYFKKADFFKLPCLGTVKRFMKKHPDVNALKKIIPNPQVDDDSSSDFEFDDSDAENKGASEDENAGTQSPESSNPASSKAYGNEMQLNEEAMESNENESSSLPEQSDTNDSKMEIQEIMLPTGEVIQCLSSSLVSNGEGQYFLIPNVGDQNLSDDREYSLVPADSLPAIAQNMDSAHQGQFIFITNNENQVDCNETVVLSQ